MTISTQNFTLISHFTLKLCLKANSKWSKTLVLLFFSICFWDNTSNIYESLTQCKCCKYQLSFQVSELSQFLSRNQDIKCTLILPNMLQVSEERTSEESPAFKYDAINWNLWYDLEHTVYHVRWKFQFNLTNPTNILAPWGSCNNL